jgi:chromosome segregation ATPase
MSSPAKVVQPEKTSHSDCYGPDSTCDQQIKDMAECFVEFTTILKRVEGKIDHLMSQTEALQAKNEEMQANLDQISRKNEEVSTKLDQITPEKIEELVKNSIAEAPILLEMRSEIKFLFEWRKNLQHHAPTKLD